MSFCGFAFEVERELFVELALDTAWPEQRASAELPVAKIMMV